MEKTIKLDGRSYSCKELKNVYNFFLNWEELIDLPNTYQKVFKYDETMNKKDE